MIGAALTALLLILLVTCLLFVCVAALITAADELWHWYRSHRPLPMAETREVRLVTDLAKWRALKGSGAERFKLSALK